MFKCTLNNQEIEFEEISILFLKNGKTNITLIDYNGFPEVIEEELNYIKVINTENNLVLLESSDLTFSLSQKNYTYNKKETNQEEYNIVYEA